MPEVDVLKITNEDAAFVLGKNGKTKEKIARVSGADLDLYEQSLTLEIRGSDAARGRAKKYVECVMAQRVGPVTIDDATDDDDLTCIQVPSEAVGFVTGARTAAAPERVSRRNFSRTSLRAAASQARRATSSARSRRSGAR